MGRQLMMVLAVASMMVLTAGCTQYYRVTDPSSGREYYTTEIEQRRSGSVEFKDARTGNRVTIQNSEVSQINKEQYNTGRSQAPSTTPAAK